MQAVFLLNLSPGTSFNVLITFNGRILRNLATTRRAMENMKQQRLSHLQNQLSALFNSSTPGL